VHPNEAGEVRSYKAERESGGEGEDAEPPRVGRRLSRRQLEKARASAAAGGGAGVDEGEAPPPISLVRYLSIPGLRLSLIHFVGT
jgi:hypothetical protein